MEKAPMQLATGLAVGIVRLLFGQKISKVNIFALVRNLRMPRLCSISWHSPDALESGLRSAFFIVALIFGVGGLSQIGEAIVGSDSIFVVDLVLGPIAADIQPRKSVGDVEFIVDAYSNVSGGWIVGPRDGPDANALARHYPDKNSGVGVVGEKRPDSIGGKHALSYRGIMITARGFS